MNENISRLAEEATYNMEFVDNTVLQTSLNDIEYKIPAEFIEKFAELIVKECGAALSPMLRDMVGRGHAYELIKQHFGVEE